MQWRRACGGMHAVTLHTLVRWYVATLRRCVRYVSCLACVRRCGIRCVALHAARCTVALPALPALRCALRVTGVPVAPGAQGTPGARGGAGLIYMRVAIHITS